MNRNTYAAGGCGLMVALLAGAILWTLLVGPLFPGEYYKVRQVDTVEAYEAFLAKYPDHESAKERLRMLRSGFLPKFFIVFEDKDFSGELSLLSSKRTSSKDQARTIVYVKTSEENVGSVERNTARTNLIVTARFVDRKNPSRERTIV